MLIRKNGYLTQAGQAYMLAKRIQYGKERMARTLSWYGIGRVK